MASTGDGKPTDHGKSVLLSIPLLMPMATIVRAQHHAPLAGKRIYMIDADDEDRLTAAPTSRMRFTTCPCTRIG
jgi:hypothetical protein